jgi:murein DD-endopeptidase MepM/ murein hydrolase activator NlpD
VRPAAALAAAFFAAALLGACSSSQPERGPTRALPPASPRAAAQRADPAPKATPSELELELTGAPAQGGLVRGRVPGWADALLLDGRPVRVSPDGQFMIAFGRDAPAGAALEVLSKGVPRGRMTLSVAARAWPVENLPGVAKTPVPQPEFEALRAPELARIRSARAQSLDQLDWQKPFAWPARGHVSGVFGSQRILGGVPADPHAGVDIATPEGTPVLAPQGGTVALASPPMFSLEGNLVILDHGYGLSSAFLHLSRVDVREGQRVEQGEPIGLSGKTGRASGPHLHWAMVWNGVRFDPRTVLPPATDR